MCAVNPGSSDKAKCQESSFPEQLMTFLECKQFGKAIWWIFDGKAFAVERKFYDDILKKTVFRDTCYTSFKRRLARWGFRRVPLEEMPFNGIAYRHRLFRRDQPHLLKNIKYQYTNGRISKPQEGAHGLNSESSSEHMYTARSTLQQNPEIGSHHCSSQQPANQTLIKKEVDTSTNSNVGQPTQLANHGVSQAAKHIEVPPSVNQQQREQHSSLIEMDSFNREYGQTLPSTMQQKQDGNLRLIIDQSNSSNLQAPIYLSIQPHQYELPQPHLLLSSPVTGNQVFQLIVPLQQQFHF